MLNNDYSSADRMMDFYYPISAQNAQTCGLNMDFEYTKDWVKNYRLRYL